MPLPPVIFPDEADPYGYDGYSNPYSPGGGGGTDGDGGAAYYMDNGPTPYEEYYQAYSNKPAEPPPVVPGPSGSSRPQSPVEERAAFVAEASIQLSSCDSAQAIAVAASEILQQSLDDSLVTLEVRWIVACIDSQFIPACSCVSGSPYQTTQLQAPASPPFT